MIIDNNQPITVDDVVKVSRYDDKVVLGDANRLLIEKSNKSLNRIIEGGDAVYGVNTGYGIFSEKRIEPKDIAILNRNLILSHAVGTGECFDTDVVKAAMQIRANTLSQGFSGIRPVVVETLIEMINKNVIPVVPCQGSLGSSGDLCQLSHLALVLTADVEDLDEDSGMATFNGKVMSGKEAMRSAGISRIILSAKEGLALNNGATFCAALSALSIADAQYLLRVAEIAAALTMEGLCATSAFLDERIHLARGQRGQLKTAEHISALLDGSTYINSMNRVQEAYSIRCAPQVHGAIADTVEYVRGIVEIELNAATDNPLIFEPGVALSGGNFHGEPLGLAMDYLSIAMCELGAISERRTNRLIDKNYNNNLPPMLVDDEVNAGLNSGLMIPHYAAASITLENQTLAGPDSIHSLPTSAGQEDHNANALTAARHTYEITKNVMKILSIELLTAIRAIDLRQRTQPGKLGVGTSMAYQKIRKNITLTPGDMIWSKDIEKINLMIKNQEL